MAPSFDPEELALLYVQQYLAEHGHMGALSALEASCGRRYDSDKLEEGSQLMQLVWGDVERRLAQTGSCEQQQQLEEEAQLRAGRGDFPQQLQASVEGLHSSSITCIRWMPQQGMMVTGSGSGMVQCFSAEGQQAWCTPVGSGGVLSLAVQPQAGEGPVYFAVGSMGGQVSVVDGRSGDLLASAQPHSKYVVRVLWCAGGRRLLSASWDQSVAVLGLQQQGQQLELRELAKVPYAAAVQDATLLPDGATAAVAVRGTSYLRMYDTSGLRELPPVNMNAAGDDHVSFYARHLALSPCGRYLLVCTDGARVLVLRTAGWGTCRTLYGLPVEQFHQPCAAWHRDSNYVFAAGAGGQLLVFHVGSAKVVASVKAHGKGLRDMAYDARSNLLATCSFDRSVKMARHIIWGVEYSLELCTASSRLAGLTGFSLAFSVVNRQTSVQLAEQFINDRMRRVLDATRVATEIVLLLQQFCTEAVLPVISVYDGARTPQCSANR